MVTNLLDGVQCILLDIDGTLVDSNEYHVKAWVEAFDHHGHRVESGVIRQHIGKGADQLIPSVRPDLSDDEREKISGAHDDVFRSRYLEQVRPFDRATALVASLHQRRLKVVLASSANRLEVDHYVKLLKIEHFLETSTCADDVENSKPAGDIFASALSKIEGAKPDQALVIGDTPYDVIAAAKCNIATLAVLSGGFPEDVLREAGACAIYESVGDVLDAMGSAH